ncbi:MAG: hypothetical protein LBT74_03275 [Acidobacteriota bacterium]|jgi:hypothetical protein|nr:hypothetical protein [Acidobacteriota bacterium]
MHDKSDEKDGATRRSFLKGAATAAVGASALAVPAGCASGRAETLEVLNPRAVLHSVPVSGLTAPRPADLAGKRIALLSEKPDASVFFDAMEKLLKERYPTATVVRMPSAAGPMTPDNSAEVAERCDVWLQGVKTSGSDSKDTEAKLEKLGKPGATFAVDGLVAQRKRLAEANGMPALRILSIPAVKFFASEKAPEKMTEIASSVFDATVKALTDPLTDAEKNPQPFVYDYGPITFTGKNSAEANEKFQQYFIDRQMGDGIALVPPTRDAVDWMLTGTSRSPEEEIGLMTPRNGMATVEKIAVNAVMAGARPEYLPVVIAAVEALVDKQFNLYHISTGTLNSTLLLWVNGPIAKEIGMNAGQGFLGYGFRANSSIGRAVSLCMINIGWALRDAEIGMQGQPARYCNLVFAENEAESPWESFAASRGYKPEDSTVTVDECISMNTLGPSGSMDCYTFEHDLDQLAGMIQGFTGPVPPESKFAGGAGMGPSDAVGIINSTCCELGVYPTLAKQAADAGYSKQALAQKLCDKYRVKWDALGEAYKAQLKAAAEAGAIPGLTPADCRPGGTVPTVNPDHVALLVVGGAVGQCVGFYGMGSTLADPERPDAPKPDFITKKIHGAALTEAGR